MDERHSVGVSGLQHALDMILVWENYFASELAYKEYGKEENFPKIANALSDICFFSILAGDFDYGEDVTYLAQGEIIKIGDVIKWYYNLNNLVLLHRCRDSYIPQIWVDQI